MQFTFKALAAGLAVSTFAALSMPVRAAEHTRARLILAAETAKPGETVLAGIHLKMDPHWHTYWKNPGQAGMATTVEWKLPQGISAGDILWPVPEKIPPASTTTYGYHDEVVLLVPLKLAPSLKPGPLELKAAVSWLECDPNVCLPGSGEVTATLTVGAELKPSADADLIKTWQAKLPKPSGPVAARAYWEGPAQKDLRPIIVEWNSDATADDVDFYPVDTTQFAVESATERLPSDLGKIKLRKQLKRFEGPWPKEISGVLIQKAGEEQLAYDATLALTSPGDRRAFKGGLLTHLFYAFIGGMILNVMPCVLPVISLKILGFVSEARNDRRRLRLFGWVYSLGVLASFLAMALITIALKAAKHDVSWGMQFSNPYFLIGMTVLMTLIALNLFGVFEVTLNPKAMNAAASLSSRHGVSGAFFNGLLATVLATSCTAPFFGAAAGFALLPGVSYSVIILMALAAGAGLAAPYLLLTWQPAWLKFLPKPGPWMERFKVAMGFPMLATAVWLCSLVSTYYGERTWAFALFLVVIAVVAWIFGQFIQRPTRHPALAWITALILLGAGYGFVLEKQLQWRNPIGDEQAKAGNGLSPEGGNWQPWNAEVIAKARGENRPVLIDFTAKWCLSCEINVKPVLGSDAVQKRLEELNAVTLLADYTRRPEELTQELYRFGRAGVPLVVVYPKDPSADPIVLPEAITTGIVLDALDRAVQ